MYNKVW